MKAMCVTAVLLAALAVFLSGVAVWRVEVTSREMVSAAWALGWDSARAAMGQPIGFPQGR